MAKKKKKSDGPEQPITEQPDEQALTLEEAKTIVNDAVQTRTPGHERDPRPDLDTLTRAKTVVNAAVMTK